MKTNGHIYYNVHWTENNEQHVRSFEKLSYAIHSVKYLVENGYTAIIVPVTMRLP